MAVFRTRSELRLEELEALRRPLTAAESADLKRCLHAIYMRNWKVEQSIRGRHGGQLLEVQKQATVETNAIAYRMMTARDESWPIPRADDWQDAARVGSDMLRDAIHAAQARARAA